MLYPIKSNLISVAISFICKIENKTSITSNQFGKRRIFTNKSGDFEIWYLLKRA